MRTISGDIYGLLMVQGLANARPASLDVRGIGDDGLAGKSARHHQPAGEESADLNLGKGRQVNAPAKFTGLRLIASDSSRRKGVSTAPLHLVPTL